MDDGAQLALVRHAAFDAFRNQLLGAGRGVLEVAVGGTGGAGHGAQRAHATVGLVGTALEQLDLARSLFGAGEHGAHHHAVGASHHGLGQVAGEADAAVGDQRNAGAFKGGGDVGDGGNLRYANTGNDTGGADRARADADLDRVRASLGQCASGFAGGDVAADHLDLRVGFLDPANAVDHALGVTVGGVHHHHVDPGVDQCSDALGGIGASADGGADAQAALVVLGRQRVGLGLLDVAEGHQAAQVEVLVDHQHLLDAVLVELGLHFFQRGAFAGGDQLFLRRHDRCHGVADVRLHTQVAAGDDADQLTLGYHREAGEAVFAGDLQQLDDLGRRSHGDRVADDGGLVLLDLAHLGSLLLDAHVLVDDADAAFLGHGDGQAGFGHGIHRGGHQRDVQFDATGQASFQAHVLGQDFRITRNQEDVVESEGFLADAQHGGGSQVRRENGSAALYPSTTLGLNARNQPRNMPLLAPGGDPSYYPPPCSKIPSNGSASIARY
ncbi:hypothetical protein D9M71_263160 [compost metagenome]